MVLTEVFVSVNLLISSDSRIKEITFPKEVLEITEKVPQICGKVFDIHAVCINYCNMCETGFGYTEEGILCHLLVSF